MELPAPAYAWSDLTLAQTARLLRAYHDAVRSFVTPPGALWNTEFAAPDGGPIICHNDVEQWNTVFRDGHPVALIDWDFAAPGYPLWDLAVAARMLVPITDSDNRAALGYEGPPRSAERLRALCYAYGLDDPAVLVSVIAQVLQMRYERRRAKVESGESRCVGINDQEVLDEMLRDITYFDGVRRDLEIFRA